VRANKKGSGGSRGIFGATSGIRGSNSREVSKGLQNSRNIRLTSVRTGATAEFKDRFRVSVQTCVVPRREGLRKRGNAEGRGKMEIKRKIEKLREGREDRKDGVRGCVLALPNDKWRPQDCASDIQLARPSSPCSALS